MDEAFLSLVKSVYDGAFLNKQGKAAAPHGVPVGPGQADDGPLARCCK